ncbi:MAG: DNA-processing protein DprA [Salibacteraceae bacterium]
MFGIVFSFNRLMDDLLYQIALKNLDGIGSTRAKLLVSYCGGVREIFDAPKKQLAKIPKLGSLLVANMNRKAALIKAEKEISFINEQEITPLFYLDQRYPKRLRHCEDGPLLLYTKGNMDLNAQKVVSVVGTRNSTTYGATLVERLIADLAPHQALIVSGLAHGIDVIAHREAYKSGLQTVGVLGNSLERIYPHQNRSLAEKLVENGGLISEFDSGTKPDRENFPQRNRIVAGMSDVTIVVESAQRGGSLITAKLAMDYNRDVMAYPGPVDAPYSKGCNWLIKTQQAHLIEGIKDLEYLLDWSIDEAESKPSQKQLFVDLTEEEQLIFKQLESEKQESLDNISLNAGVPVSKASTLLLQLEFKGVVRSLPGKIYALN